MSPNLCSTNELCALLAGEGRTPLSEMSISNFVSEGMPRAERGLYDPIACARWYIGRLRQRASESALPRTKEAALKALLSGEFRPVLQQLVVDVMSCPIPPKAL